MPKRLSKKPPADVNTAAFRLIARIAADETPAEVVHIRKRKNPAAVALGRKGGQKSAVARMEKIAPETRRKIASTAARARWAKEKGNSG